MKPFKIGVLAFSLLTAFSLILSAQPAPDTGPKEEKNIYAESFAKARVEFNNLYARDIEKISQQAAIATDETLASQEQALMIEVMEVPVAIMPVGIHTRRMELSEYSGYKHDTKSWKQAQRLQNKQMRAMKSKVWRPSKG